MPADNVPAVYQPPQRQHRNEMLFRNVRDNIFRVRRGLHRKSAHGLERVGLFPYVPECAGTDMSLILGSMVFAVISRGTGMQSGVPCR